MDCEDRELLWTILRKQQAQHDQIEHAIRLLGTIRQELRNMSDTNASAIAGLTAADNALTAEVGQAVSAVQADTAQIASLTAQLAAGNAPTAELVTAIQQATANAQSNTAALAAALQPPAPAPAATVAGAA